MRSGKFDFDYIIEDKEAYLPYGSHNEDEEYCAWCEKIYVRTNRQSCSAYGFVAVVEFN
jgi:hypothetical protein